MFSLPQPILATALKRLFYALDANSKLDALTHIRVDASGDTVRFSATSSKISAEAVVPAGAMRKDRMLFGTAGALLKNLVLSFPPDAFVTFSLEGTTLFLKTPTSTFRLPVLDPGVIPVIYDYANVGFIKADIKALVKGISKVSFCSDKDGAHDYHKGVYINQEHFVATDGFRMACAPNPGIPCGPKGTLLPYLSAVSIVKMFPGTVEGGVSVDQSTLHIYGDGLYASIRLLADSFPDYKSILPKAQGAAYEFDKSSLLPPLERLSLISSGKAPFVKFSFKAQDKTLYLTSESDLGKGYEGLTCEPLVDQEICLNNEHLVDALKNIPEDKVTLEFFMPPNDGLMTIRAGDYFHVHSTVAR